MRWTACIIFVLIGAQFVFGGGDICREGYTSSTGRIWSFSSLPLLGISAGKFLYTTNVCNRAPVPCGSDSAACQIEELGFFSLGSLRTTNVTDLSDLAINVQYTNGTPCRSGVPRSINFQISCSSAFSDFISIEETGTCQYTARIRVEEVFCRSKFPITTSGSTGFSSIATTTSGGSDVCGSTGYVSPTGRTWLLAYGAELVYSNEKYSYFFNPCGVLPTPCGSDAGVCQLELIDNKNNFSLGYRPTAKVVPVSDQVLSISYSGGARCLSGGIARYITVTLSCTAGPSSFVAVTEPATCGYEATINLNEAYCRPGGSSGSGSGSSHFSAVASAAGGLRLG